MASEETLDATRTVRQLLTARHTAVVLLLAGASVRLWQYLANPALWMDELALAHSLITRPIPLLLLVPLDDGQVAPPGYLVVSRLAVLALGPNEYALRLFPLLCSLAALPLFGRLAMRLLRPGAAVLAIALFTLTSGLILYAAEAKQYAVDLLVALVISGLALRRLDGESRGQTAALTVVGVLAVWFSQPAVFVLAGVALALALDAEPRERRTLVAVFVSWATAAALSIAYARTRLSPGLMAYMMWFWRDGVMPRPLHHLNDLLWPIQALEDVFELLLDYPWPVAYLGLAGWGAVSFLRRRRGAALILLLPLVMALLAAVARLYPFQLRLVLFLVPALLLFVSEGAYRLAGFAPAPVVRILLLLAVAAPPVLALLRNPPVWRLDDVRPVFAELQRRRLPGDAVFAYYPAWQALRFYGPRYALSFDTLDLGACHPTDLHDYLRELDRYRGRSRLWFVISFSLVRAGEVQPMLDYLDTIGVRRATIEAPPNNRPGISTQRIRWDSWRRTAAFLYDLSDPGRLASADAAGRQVPPAFQFLGVPRCIYGPAIPHVPTVGL